MFRPFEQSRIVPVVVIDDAANALETAAALAEGGIHTAEITLRTPAALRAIAAIAGRQDFTVGAGTVFTAEQVDMCVDAGAQYIVSPGFDDKVVKRAIRLGVAVLPGVATATEVQRAQKAGLSAVKFFPAEASGGPATISALAGPFPNMRFLPSGGITESNAAQYLAHPSVFAVSASWMVPREAISSGDFELIRSRSRKATAGLGVLA